MVTKINALKGLMMVGGRGKWKGRINRFGVVSEKDEKEDAEDQANIEW